MRVNSMSFPEKKISLDKKTSFMSYNPNKASEIEHALSRKGISLDSAGNDFVATCVQKVVNVFDGLFSKSYIPKNVSYRSLSYGVYGIYYNGFDEVAINNEHDLGCFKDMKNLTTEMKRNYKRYKPNWFSSMHPAHIFVHEFSHGAHWHNLIERNGESGAYKIWNGLEGASVPNAIGRLIARFKLSKYAVDSYDMCEFMAERMTQDICKGMSESSWSKTSSIDVKYSDIFSRKWHRRYSSPQAYVDYFTQQVWNGDIDEAKRAGRLAGEYLSEIEYQKAPGILESTGIGLDATIGGFGIFRKLGKNVSEALETFADNCNKIKLKNNQY